jgi:hypothetical protein
MTNFLYVRKLEVHQELDSHVFIGELYVNEEEEDVAEMMHYVDDLSGEKPNSKLVKNADDEELDYMRNFGFGERCCLEEAGRLGGKAPTTTKFVRTNKGSPENPDVLARLCARYFKSSSDSSIELFACMAPLEAKKMLFRKAICEKKKLVFINVRKAQLSGKVPEDTFAYVQLPTGEVWRLRGWLCGMRPAAAAWVYWQHLERAGFTRGRSSPTVLHRKETGCSCVVHADDSHSSVTKAGSKTS